MTLSDTLYLADLDGTLLTPQVTLSARSAELLGKFIARGGKFSISTARTPATFFHIIGDLPLCHPISMMNGVLIYDPISRRYVREERMSSDTAKLVLEVFEQGHVEPVVFFLTDDQFYPTYRSMSPMLREYAREREIKYGKRFYPVDSLENEMDSHRGAIYFCAREREESLLPLLPALKAIPGIRAECYRDVYSPGAFYLEVFSDRASKEASTHTLRELTGVRHVVSFGDNLNDIPMFREAARAAATATIGPNTADGVAEFLSNIF